MNVNDGGRKMTLKVAVGSKGGTAEVTEVSSITPKDGAFPGG